MICLNYNASMKSQWPHFKAHLMLQTHHQLSSLSSSNKLENPPFYFAENCQGISLGSLKEKEGSRLLTTRWASLIKFLDFPSQKWIPKKRASMSQPLWVSYTRNTLRNHPGPAKVCRSHGQHNFSWACFFCEERMIQIIFKHDMFGLRIETTIYCFFRTSKVWNEPIVHVHGFEVK